MQMEQILTTFGNSRRRGSRPPVTFECEGLPAAGIGAHSQTDTSKLVSTRCEVDQAEDDSDVFRSAQPDIGTQVHRGAISAEDVPDALGARVTRKLLFYLGMYDHGSCLWKFDPWLTPLVQSPAPSQPTYHVHV